MLYVNIQCKYIYSIFTYSVGKIKNNLAALQKSVEFVEIR